MPTPVPYLGVFVSVEVRGLVAHLLLATGRPVDVECARSSRSAWGHHAALAHPDFAGAFARTAAELGFTAVEARCQWGALAKIIATTGAPPEALDSQRLGAAAADLTAAHTRQGGRVPLSWSTPLHGLTATLAAMGVLADAPPTRLSPPGRRAADPLAPRRPPAARWQLDVHRPGPPDPRPPRRPRRPSRRPRRRAQAHQRPN